MGTQLTALPSPPRPKYLGRVWGAEEENAAQVRRLISRDRKELNTQGDILEKFKVEYGDDKPSASNDGPTITASESPRGYLRPQSVGVGRALGIHGAPRGARMEPRTEPTLQPKPHGLYLAALDRTHPCRAVPCECQCKLACAAVQCERITVSLPECTVLRGYY